MPAFGAEVEEIFHVWLHGLGLFGWTEGIDKELFPPHGSLVHRHATTTQQ